MDEKFMTIRGIVKNIQILAEQLDEHEIETLVEEGVSSSTLRDIAEILVDLANCIDHHRDAPFYKGRIKRKLRRIK